LSVGFVGLKLLFKWLSAGWVVGGDFHHPPSTFGLRFGLVLAGRSSRYSLISWKITKIFAYLPRLLVAGCFQSVSVVHMLLSLELCWCNKSQRENQISNSQNIFSADCERIKLAGEAGQRSRQPSHQKAETKILWQKLSQRAQLVDCALCWLPAGFSARRINILNI